MALDTDYHFALVWVPVVGDKLDYANSTLKTEAGYLLAGAPFENGLSKAKV